MRPYDSRTLGMPTAATLAAVLGLTAPAAAQDDGAPPAPLPLRVAYVGEPGTPRAAAFAAFLRERCAGAETFERFAAAPEALQQFDVVLLDWPQSDAARAQRLRGAPLGARDAWRTPTVLLGSAGLNVAVAWAVRGGSG